MSKEIVIDPVTRIEGHSKITIQVDDAGEVQDAHFHVTQFRGFEKFCEGRPFAEMPSITTRICGIAGWNALVRFDENKRSLGRTFSSHRATKDRSLSIS